ncbi:hypothetical protein ATANTOWER_013090, partial [Ataeniobius toweri]|nr:hypothetical protein [Ataeniobius toweri]
MCMCDLVCWLLCLCPAMENKDSSYLKTSSFRSSSLHFGPSKTHFMTEGTSQLDQPEGMVREFKRGEILAKLFSHLAAFKTGSRQGGVFFPDPRIHHIIKAEQQR